MGNVVEITDEIILDWLNERFDELEGVRLSDAWRGIGWNIDSLLEKIEQDDEFEGMVLALLDDVFDDLEGIKDQILEIIEDEIRSVEDETEGLLDGIIDDVGGIIDDGLGFVGDIFDGIGDVPDLFTWDQIDARIRDVVDVPDIGNMLQPLVDGLGGMIEPAIEYLVDLIWSVASDFLDPNWDVLVDGAVKMWEIQQEVQKKIAATATNEGAKIW